MTKLAPIQYLCRTCDTMTPPMTLGEACNQRHEGHDLVEIEPKMRPLHENGRSCGRTGDHIHTSTTLEHYDADGNAVSSIDVDIHACVSPGYPASRLDPPEGPSVSTFETLPALIDPSDEDVEKIHEAVLAAWSEPIERDPDEGRDEDPREDV